MDFSGRFLEFEQRRAGLNQLSDLAANRLDHAVAGRSNGEFHLHRLEHHDHVVPFDALARRDVDGKYGGRHRCGERRLIVDARPARCAIGPVGDRVDMTVEEDPHVARCNRKRDEAPASVDDLVAAVSERDHFDGGSGLVRHVHP